MKWSLAGVLAALLVDMHAVPADACGIKLVIKTQTPHKAVARSSNPSHLLLLGTPPHRLERELSAAGHDVEVEPTISTAKQTSYAVIVTDAKQADEARAKFPSAVVIVRSGDVTADINSIESQVTRRPIRTGESRPVVAAAGARRPIATGPAQQRPVAVKEPGEAPPAVKEPTPPQPPAPAATPPRVATATPPLPEQPPPAREPPVRQASASKPAPQAQRAEAASLREVYFSLGSANISNRKGILDRAARWLKESSDVHVVIEGHADPTGTHEGNMILSQHRAEAVRDYLAAAGIDESRMEVVPYGDTRLKYGRADGRNRRVAIEPKP
jgi:outer membrane protein OmpA-like peptidoglycan-associated protein